MSVERVGMGLEDEGWNTWGIDGMDLRYRGLDC